MADDELPAADEKAARSIKRTPWKVDVRNRLARVREDMEMAIRTSGWKITGAPAWPCADGQPGDGSSVAITLESQDGGAGTPQMHPSYFPLCVQKQTTHGTTITCPTGGHIPDKADMALIMAIGGIGALLAVATNLSGLKPTGVRYSLSVAQGLIKIPFGAVTAMLGIIIVSTQPDVGVLATQAGLLGTATVFGYSQQLFTKFIDKQASNLLTKAGGSG